MAEPERKDESVATNEQRRAAAKRKLERQLERRAAKARKQRIFTIAGVSVVVVAAVAAVVTLVVVNRNSSTASAAPGGAGENCQYPAAGQASKQVNPPRTGKVPTDPATVSVSMVTTAGNIGLQLDNGHSPCTVNSFASLAGQNYFNDTPCHRLTSGGSLSVLQCGDPSGTGTGGPGYRFADEYPVTDYPAGSADADKPISYPRGTLAMANAGPGTNGSQFFLVYKDSQLPPKYTKFGTIDETGLATLDKIAAAGVKDGAGDGAPATPVQIKSVALD